MSLYNNDIMNTFHLVLVFFTTDLLRVGNAVAHDETTIKSDDAVILFEDPLSIRYTRYHIRYWADLRGRPG